MGNDGIALTGLTIFCVRVLTNEGKRVQKEGRRILPAHIISTSYALAEEGHEGVFRKTPSNMRQMVSKGERVPHWALGVPPDYFRK